jgi:type I restriction enzyme R subunit
VSRQARKLAVTRRARLWRELLQKFKEKFDVFRWRDRQQTRAAVLSEIRVSLNDLPEEPYPQLLWDQKVDGVWQFVFSRYPGPELALSTPT